MNLNDHLSWPFFDDNHRNLAVRVEEWADANVHRLVDHDDIDGSCSRLVEALGSAGLLALSAPQNARFDVRSLCIVRETLARHDALADFAFAMQGLGSGPLTLAASTELKQRILPGVRAGSRIAAFALTEPQSGSDVANISLAAEPAQDGFYRLDGEKVWISNGGIAHQYVVFARMGEQPGAGGLSAFLVEAGTPGLTIAERLTTIAPHPLARLGFENCRVPEANLLGAAGQGFGIAMATLDIFRPTVGAAALGLARRALEITIKRVNNRVLFGAPLAAMQLTQVALAEMATAIETSALLVYRAAWARDCGSGQRITREAAMAKLMATEMAQQVIDKAVQLHGAEGVRSGSVPESLYREIRALRIYEGASEVQKLIIARQILGAQASR